MSDVLTSPPARILTPGDPGWDDARQAWNLAVDQHPAAVALPACVQDVWTPSVSLARTALAVPIEEVSAKVRSGPPKDDEEDYALPVWAGVLPLALVPGNPVPDPRLDPAVPVPSHVAGWDRRGTAVRAPAG